MAEHTTRRTMGLGIKDQIFARFPGKSGFCTGEVVQIQTSGGRCDPKKASQVTGVEEQAIRVRAGTSIYQQMLRILLWFRVVAAWLVTKSHAFFCKVASKPVSAKRQVSAALDSGRGVS